MKRIALLLVSLLFLSGCANTEETPEPVARAAVFFVGDTPRGFKLFKEMREFPQSDDLSTQIISDLVSGKIAPLDPNYVNLWGSANVLNGITAKDGVATIDLGTISLNVGAEAESRAIDQIVETFLDFNTAVQSVRFTVNGEVVESFAGHVDTTGSFTRGIDYEILNPLQISSIVEGDSVSSPVTITGEACTFEANVFWRISKDGKVVKEGSTTAGEACPVRSSWSVELGTLDPGSYKFEAIEYSAEDGSLFAIDDKNFIVK